jgi:hypothetical protein
MRAIMQPVKRGRRPENRRIQENFLAARTKARPQTGFARFFKGFAKSGRTAEQADPACILC